MLLFINNAILYPILFRSVVCCTKSILTNTTPGIKLTRVTETNCFFFPGNHLFINTYQMDDFLFCFQIFNNFPDNYRLFIRAR